MTTILEDLVLNRTSQDRELSVLVEFDFSQRHEIADAAETITGTPTVRALTADESALSTNLTVASVALDSTSKKVQFRVTVGANASAGDEYVISVAAVLSGGATLVEKLRTVIQ